MRKKQNARKQIYQDNLTMLNRYKIISKIISNLTCEYFSFDSILNYLDIYLLEKYFIRQNCSLFLSHSISRCNSQIQTLID